jgi:hypothetical protein
MLTPLPAYALPAAIDRVADALAELRAALRGRANLVRAELKAWKTPGTSARVRLDAEVAVARATSELWHPTDRLAQALYLAKVRASPQRLGDSAEDLMRVADRFLAG